MTQAKRPISRSSTPIEFTPLVLDLEPEVIEEPKQQRGYSKLLATLFGIVIVLGGMGYYWFRESSVGSEIRTVQTTKTGISQIVSVSNAYTDEKKAIFTYGAKHAKITLENIDGYDVMKVTVQDKVVGGVTWVYEWTKNNRPFGKGDSVRGFKRGDSVAVKITPFDGEIFGPARVLTSEVKNTVPRVVEGQLVTIEGKNLTFHVKAVDADGDTLTYSLVDGPAGVNIDKKSGAVTWVGVPDDAQKLEVKVKINDGHNGEIIYPASVNFSKLVNENLTAQK